MSFLIIEGDDDACHDCNRIMPVGTPYSTRLVAFNSRFGEMLEVICVYCAAGPAEYCPDVPGANIDTFLRDLP